MKSLRFCIVSTFALGLGLVGCGGNEGPSTGAAGVVAGVRGRAEGRFRKLLTQPGVGSVIHSTVATSSGGQQFTHTELLNFWRKGGQYRVEGRDTGGASTGLSVFDGQTLRSNLDGMGLTRELAVGGLKAGNQQKLAASLSGGSFFHAIDRGVPQITEDDSNFYLSVGPIPQGGLGNLWLTWTVDKTTYDVTKIENHLELPSGAVRDETFQFSQDNTGDVPAALFTLPPRLARVVDVTGNVDSFLDQAP